MRTITTTLDLDAPPDAVWAVLADFGSWSRWNPTVCGVHGELVRGARLRLDLVVPGWMLHPRVTLVTVEPGRALAWRGGVTGLFEAVHGFRVEPRGAGTRFVHHESFTGVVAALAWPALQAVLGPRYAAANEGLAAEVARRRAISPS